MRGRTLQRIGNPRMSFPPELIDRILKYLRDDPQSLSAASSVSKAWTSWGQTYLFESVHLTPSNLRGWLDNVTPGVDGPASHTRTLTLEEYRLLPLINPQSSAFPLSNLVSFTNVRSLILIQWNTRLFNGASLETYFGHFGKSLRALSLRFCTLGPATLFNFLSLLPNVQDLHIAYPSPQPDSLDTVPDVQKVTLNFSGTLSLVDFNPSNLILKVVAALPSHFTTIAMRGCAFYEPEAYQTLFTSCRDTLVTLRFENSYRGALEVFLGHPACPHLLIRPDLPVPGVSLASCNKLEEVYALFASDRKIARPIVNLLSSITSQKFRKISLSFFESFSEGDSDSDEDYRSDEEEEGVETWETLDTTLSRLAKDVSGTGGRLTLQLSIRHPDSVQRAKFEHLLSQFLEYGRLDVTSGAI